MTQVYIVWYINPELGNRYNIWGVYDTEYKAITACKRIEKEFGYVCSCTIEDIR